MKKRGYSSLVSSSTTKSGTYLNISETVLRTQLFSKLVLMGHFALKTIPRIELGQIWIMELIK